MIAGLTGSLLSHDALELLLRQPGRWGVDLRDGSALAGTLRRWYSHVRPRLGPTASARIVFDLVAEPLARRLGFGVVPIAGNARSGTVDAVLHTGTSKAAVMIASAWGQPSDGLWRHAVHSGLAHDVRWCLCVTGPSLRIFDAARAYSRRFVDFNLEVALEDSSASSILAGLFGARAMTARKAESTLEYVVVACERHRTEVRLSLRDGVYTALVTLVRAFKAAVPRKHRDADLLNESLIVIYRILFLLFAEARALVPRWHPVYAQSYTLEPVTAAVERGSVPAGLWETLQAMARLAHRGCRAGSLRVPPFNGRLFSPSDAPLADVIPLDDAVVSKALAALTTKPSKDERQRISYADLGVEQLGGIYEHLLDFDVAPGERRSAAVLVGSGRRKATGSFYTPRSLTEFLVRRTLAPIVQDRSPDEILALRVVDPAMGSGAFLVAACRYLAGAYEQALIREGSITATDLDAQDRAAFRRVIAQRCLFGVDINPMAVQLGRLSLWLSTLAADRPLTFLDHHLRTGNSLVGASIDDVRRQPAPGRMARATADLPLFATDALQQSLESAVDIRLKLASTPDDTVHQVRAKEKELAWLCRPDGPLERWKRAADLWCAAWHSDDERPRDRAMFGALLDRVMRQSGTLPAHLAEPLLAHAEDMSRRHRFFHWTLEFPEAFYDAGGNPLGESGFDAVLGNPPWEMLRDEGGQRRNDHLIKFVRGSGLFRLQGKGHANLYQLFIERAVGLLKPGGRGGMILPSGFGTDQGCGSLRRHLFDRTSVDTYTGLDNRDGIFPIHRALKFLLVTFTNGGRTAALPARTDVRSVEALDRVPDAGMAGGEILLPIDFITRMSGEGLAVPEIRTPLDLEIASDLTVRFRASADPDGWGIHFGRELNATEDRHHFREGPGLPVVEGKHMRPFSVETEASDRRIPVRIASRLLDADATFGRARLGYRDVASPSNRTTLIAAIVPANTVTTHTIFCLKERLSEAEQWFLCGVFNSYVANYLIRMRVGTHVTTAVVARLPLPKPGTGSATFEAIVDLARELAREHTLPAAARLNAAVGRLYGLSGPQFRHVLTTFPLVDANERCEALRLFTEDDV